MRSISTLATLLVGLAVVFWAPAAKAHCPHGSDVKHCPDVEPPGATLGDLECGMGEIAKYDGAMWDCAVDEDTVTNTDIILAAIADLQESVDDLVQLALPCGAGTVGERFVLLDGGEEVCDNTTGLIWDQRPDSADSVTRTLQQALDHCPTLGAGSRLPEIKELLSLLDYSQFDPALPAGHPFTNDTNFSQGRYWSVTEIAAGDPIGAWRMGLHEGDTGPHIGSSSASTWCVRDGP